MHITQLAQFNWRELKVEEFVQAEICYADPLKEIAKDTSAARRTVTYYRRTVSCDLLKVVEQAGVQQFFICADPLEHRQLQRDAEHVEQLRLLP